MKYLIKCGIARCTSEQFEKIEKNDYIRFKKNKYEYDVLVEDKSKFKKKYKIEVYKRNEEQENEYNKDQEEMQNKLEEAYKIEKLSNNANQNVDEKQESNKSNIILLGIIPAMFVIILVILGCIYWKKRNIK